MLVSCLSCSLIMKTEYSLYPMVSIVRRFLKALERTKGDEGEAKKVMNGMTL